MLKALADDTRWRIVQALLATDRATVTDLANQIGVTQPKMSKHLRILREAGIVVAEKESREVWCQIEREFRKRMRGGGKVLDLGCCTFRFDQEPPG